MDIKTYRSERGITQTEFAKQLTDMGSPATQGLVYQWEKGIVLVPPQRWRFIESLTDGLVTRRDMRPDIYGEAA